MRKVTALTIMFLILGINGSAWGACGDVTADGHVDISDLVYLLVYTGSNGWSEPAPPNPSDADVDGRAGLTMGDVVALVRYIFSYPSPPLDCSGAKTYTFGPSTTDSVFFPRMLTVPDGVDTVIMPIITNLEAGTQGVFLSYLKKGPGNANFALHDLIWETPPSSVIKWDNADYWVADDTGGIEAISLELPNSNFTGRHSIGSLLYVRTAPGAGSINPALVDRTSLLKPSVEKSGDLFVPTTQYYNFAFPPETLLVSSGSHTFDAVAGYPATDSFVVHFTSSGLPILFTLTPSEPWIVVVDTGAVGFRTPADVVIKADATTTGIGNYTGQITFTSLSPAAPTAIPYIDISMTVRAPNIYPFGDLDCDGVVDISDLSKLIDHLFMSLTPLTPCQP